MSYENRGYEPEQLEMFTKAEMNHSWASGFTIGAVSVFIGLMVMFYFFLRFNLSVDFN